MYYYNPNELYHYGILGMKWGVRRYQNPDGTRTALGKARERKQKDPVEQKRKVKNAATIGAAAAGLGAIGYGVTKGATKKFDTNKLFSQTLKDGKDKPNISPAEKMGKEARKIGSELGTITKTVDKATKLSKGRESKVLTDEELKKRINRMNLEKQYETLVEEDFARGHVTASEILESVGAVVSIGASAATIIGVAKMVSK